MAVPGPHKVSSVNSYGANVLFIFLFQRVPMLSVSGAQGLSRFCATDAGCYACVPRTMVAAGFTPGQSCHKPVSYSDRISVRVILQYLILARRLTQGPALARSLLVIVPAFPCCSPALCISSLRLGRCLLYIHPDGVALMWCRTTRKLSGTRRSYAGCGGTGSLPLRASPRGPRHLHAVWTQPRPPPRCN